MFSKGIIKTKLETEFSNYLNQVIPKEKWLSVFKEAILELWKDRGSKTGVEIKRHKASLSLLEAKLKRVFEMREDGSYTKVEFQERKAEIEGEIAISRIALKSLQIDEYDIGKALSYAIDFIGSLAQKWLILPISQQRRFQKLVFPEGIPYCRNQGFGTAKLGYIFELIRTFSDQKSSTVHLTEVSWNQITEELEKWNKAIQECEHEEQYSKTA